MDLKTILAGAKCFNEYGYEIYKNINFEKYCNNNFYGSSLFKIINFLGLETESYYKLGIIGIIIIISIFSYEISKIKRIKLVLLSLILAISPPIQLLLERSNIDWIIFTLIYLGVKLIYGLKKFEYFGIFLIMLSACFKYYSFPVGLIAIRGVNNNFKKITSFFIILCSSFFIINDLMRINTNFTNFHNWFASFGLSIYGEYINKLNLVHINIISSYFIGFIVSIILLKIITKMNHHKNSEFEAFNLISDEARIYYVLTLFCFVLGNNYDYRLIFFIFFIILIINKDNIYYGNSLITSSFFVTYFSYNTYIFQIFGDLVLNYVLVLITFLIFRKDLNVKIS